MKPDNVREYFDSKAPNYINKFGRMPWNMRLWNVIKRKEQSAVFKMLAPTFKDFILDAGCGSGYYLSALVKKGYKAEGIDFSSGMVDEARKYGLPVRVADLEEGIDAQSRYNKVICAGVLEFCISDMKVLMGLKNILSPYGVIVLLLPRAGFSGVLYKMFHRYYGCGENIKLYSITEIVKLSGSCGLKIDDVMFVPFYSWVVKMHKSGDGICVNTRWLR